MWVSTCYIPVYIPRGTAFDRGMLDTNGHKPVDSLKMLDSPSLKSSDSSEKQQSENADFTAFPTVSVANRYTNYFEVNDEVNDF